MRNAFTAELVALAERNPNILLLVGDLGFSVIEPFAERFPERFVNAGVAEQNMMGLAAGLASEGWHVFVYSIANFPTFRCAEQIRNDVAYHQLPVTIVTVGGGLAYGALGYSHHAVQDYALMRALPNMLIAAPGDPMQVRACLRYLDAHPQPAYLRLGKAGEPSFHDAPPALTPGAWMPVAGGAPHTDRCLLTTGATLQTAMQWRTTAPNWADVPVYAIPLWGMQHKAAQPAQIARWQQVFTLEDHLADAGFGSWLLEAAAAEAGLVERIRPIALRPEVCGMVAGQGELNAAGGLFPP